MLPKTLRVATEQRHHHLRVMRRKSTLLALVVNALAETRMEPSGAERVVGEGTRRFPYGGPCGALRRAPALALESE
jgi:hypothetical protein